MSSINPLSSLFTSFLNFSNQSQAGGQNTQTQAYPLINRRRNGNRYGQIGQQQQPMMSMLQSILQSIFGMLGSLSRMGGYSTPTPPVYTPPEPPVYNPPTQTPPVYTPPEPPVYNPPTPTPPVYTPPQNKVLGSAGLFGDPQFGVFTPNLGNIPAALRGFESGIQTGQTVTLLNDADLGGLNVEATGIQVDPSNPNSHGVGTATFKSGNDTVTIQNSGDLLVNGQVRGNIKSSGLIAPIQLANGVTVSTSLQIDGANGQMAERFVIQNGEYKITAALRSPSADSQSYFDMNFEELVATAADNATGYRTSVPGLTSQFGIVDLLKLEPGVSISA